MASLKRQKSWHEDFARNFFRLFSRSKSLDQEKSDVDADRGEEHEDDGTRGQFADADPLSTPEHDLTMASGAQTLECPELDGGVAEGEGDVERDPTAPEPCSPAPPVDGFFKRLGSLFLFTRTEPGETERASRGAADPTAHDGVDVSVEDGHLKGRENPGGPSQSVACPVAEATLQPEQERPHTRPPEETLAEEDGERAVERSSTEVEEEEEESRRRALASPPVVTHVTYRGFRKMRRKQEVRLHSPISEGEEGQPRAGTCLSTSEEDEFGAGSVSPVSASCSNSQAGHPGTKTANSSVATSDLSGTHFSTPILAEGTDGASGQSAIQTEAGAKAKPVGLDSDPLLTSDTFYADQNIPSNLAASADGSCETFVSELVSGHEPRNLSPSLSSDALTHADTHSNTPLTVVNSSSSSHAHLIGLDIASDCCHIVSCQDTGGSDNRQDLELSSEAEITAHSGLQAGGTQGDGIAQLGLVTDSQTGLDEDTLQLESKKMVDDVLKKALAALERIDASQEKGEGAEAHKFVGVRDDADDPANLNPAFRDRLVARTDGNPESALSDDTLGGRVQVDANRSTPSSGYESIAGSDTDIRSMSADVALAGCPITELELRERTGSGGCTEKSEQGVVGSPVCRSGGQDSLHSSAFLFVSDLEEREGTAANKELLFQYALSDSNISHKTTQPTISQPLSGVNKGQVECVLEESGVHIAVTENDTGPQCVTKDNSESNIHNHTLDSDSGVASLIVNNGNDSSQMKHVNKSLSPVEVDNFDSKELMPGNVFKIWDHSEKESRTEMLVRESPLEEEATLHHSVSGESLKNSELASQGQQSKPETVEESSFALVKPYLVSVVEDGQDGETDEAQKHTAGPIGSTNSGVTSDFQSFSAVKVFVCTVTDETDQNHSREQLRTDLPIGYGPEKAGVRLTSLPISTKAHLDLPGTFARPHSSDSAQSPRGFAIISEEEETDTVFVNDTGPMLSPSSRRCKAYPFSLSPIYEEDSGREDASHDDVLQVPPATGEEQRSVEQQASSVLSLLQSVSERLQASGLSHMEMEGGVEEKLDDPDLPHPFLRPLWDRYDNNDNDVTPDEEDSFLLHRQLTGITILSEETVKEDLELPFFSAGHKPSKPQGEEPEPKCCEATLNVLKTANTPFYQYLKSSAVASFETEQQGVRKDLRQNSSSPVSFTVGEMGGSGKVNPRPTLLHIYEGPDLSGHRKEVVGDVEDARQVLFQQGATIKALRGCWLLYVEPGYRGSSVLLEEGQTVTTSGERDGLPSTPPLSVGSIRRVVKDDAAPEIHLHKAGTPMGEPVRLHSQSDHVDTGGPVRLSDLSVRSGCWLAYDGAGFTGNLTVLEAGSETPPTNQNSPVSCVRSLRPARMGGLRVRRPLDPKILVYEKPLFQGQCRELLVNTSSLEEAEGMPRVCSVQVKGGVWVGYSSENYRGQQCLLEEGEYSDCAALFSRPEQTLKSCRFLLADFIEPVISLKSSGEQLELVDQDVEDLQLAEQLQEDDGILVRNGVWVAYSGRCYTGEQCVLEKGQHPGALDWDDKKSAPLSIRPVRRELSGEREPEFLLCVFSEVAFAGECREFVAAAADCSALSPASFRAAVGSWVLYDEEGFCGNQFVLGEGLYPDLISCGCAATSIKSFRPVPYSLSDPSISLFSLSGFEGLKTVADSPQETMDHFFTQSLRVHSGMWVAYEFGQFKGRQMLLQAGEWPCWVEHSGWDTVGSLHPLRQRCAYLQVRSRALGTALSAEKASDPSSPVRLALRAADRSQDSQHWVHAKSLLKSKVGKCCLSVIGGRACVGARVALWEEHGRTNQKWSLNENGTISTHLNPNLVLDRKGGSGIDRDHLILNEFCASSATQYWDVEVLQ